MRVRTPCYPMQYTRAKRLSATIYNSGQVEKQRHLYRHKIRVISSRVQEAPPRKNPIRESPHSIRLCVKHVAEIKQLLTEDSRHLPANISSNQFHKCIGRQTSHPEDVTGRQQMEGLISRTILVMMRSTSKETFVHSSRKNNGWGITLLLSSSVRKEESKHLTLP